MNSNTEPMPTLALSPMSRDHRESEARERPTVPARSDGSELDRARAAALRLLKYRARSAWEMRSRLRLKGFEAPTIEALCGELSDAGLIDDESFARELVESQLRKGPAGPPMLRARLRAAGVAGELSDRVIAECLAHSDPRADARAFVERSLGKAGADQPAEKLTRRLLAALARRGVEHEIAREVVADAIRTRTACPETPPNDASA